MDLPNSFTEAAEKVITSRMRDEAVANAKRAGSNKIERVTGFKFPKHAPKFKMPGDK